LAKQACCQQQMGAELLLVWLQPQLPHRPHQLLL
jgi:hypothetical protein